MTDTERLTYLGPAGHIDPLGPGVCRGATHHGRTYVTEVNRTHIGCTFGPELRVEPDPTGTTCQPETWRPPAWDQHPAPPAEPPVIPWPDEQQDSRPAHIDPRQWYGPATLLAPTHLA